MKHLLSVVVNYHTDDLLQKFLESYFKYVDEEGRDLVVYDVEASADKTYDRRWDPYDGTTWITNNANCGYAYAVNSTIDKLGSGYLNYGIFNADTAFVDQNCVDSCLDLLDSNEDVGAVGPLQYDSRGRITHAGIFGTNTQPMHRDWLSRDIKSHRYISDCVSVSGSAYFTKRDVWNEMKECELYSTFTNGSGAFLPTQHFYEETFYSYHIREHGYRILYNGEAEMIHEWHQSSPVDGVYVNDNVGKSRKMFREACGLHGIECD